MITYRDKPCVKCGGHNFNGSNRCHDCAKARTAKWRAENREQHLAHGSKSRTKNRDPKLHTEAAMRNKANRLKRVPAWSETEEIKNFYSLCPEGYEVDHIVPLCGKLVSGLHVLSNLQYLTKEENRRKGNSFDTE